MRYSRLSLVAVAHGSADPRAGAAIGELMDLVRSRAPGLDVRVAFLGHAAPSVPAVLGGLRGPAVVVPLLLTAAYHSKIDLPAQLATARTPVRYAPVLGPHPLLLDAASRRVASAGAHDRGSTGIVLAAAGSSDPSANAAIRGTAAAWAATGSWRSVVPAFASGAGPSAGEAVRSLLRSPGIRRVVVASYLLAPGFFADRIRADALAAGADAVAEPLGALPEVADVVLDRYAVSAAAPAAA
jgi:sirohydrochlorin ferrochelatase